MAGLDNKISNIIGTSIPIWLLKQLEARSEKNTLNSRDTQNILYLANKSAWIRVVSSVNIAEEDIAYFKTLGATISKPDDLAKNYVLFGGTSKYKGANNKNVPSYDIRSGLQNDGAYNLLNNTEINEYGYRPMPGITSVNIETQGALGSIRGATINFKVWDKNQLDIMDALYFKLGYSMFLEWGHTYFYHSSRESRDIDPNVVYSTEDFSIDAFADNLKKEEIYTQISKNVRDSEGNYDAMLGVVTNFNFNYNEAGGFDCTLKLMSLGYLGDRIKINHSKTLPDILEAEIKQLNEVYKKIENAKLATELSEKEKEDAEALRKQLAGKVSIFEYLNDQVNPNSPGRLNRSNIERPYFPTQPERQNIVDEARILNSFTPLERENIVGASNILDAYKQENNAKFDPTTVDNFKNSDYLLHDILYLPKFGVQIPKENTDSFIQTISLNKDFVLNRFNEALSTYNALPDAKRTVSNGFQIGTTVEYILANEKTVPPLSAKQAWSKLLKGIETGILTYIADNSNLRKNMFSRFYAIPEYSGNNNDSYNIYIKITLPNDVRYVNTDDRFKSVLDNILNKESFNFTKFSIETNESDSKKFYLVLTGDSEFAASKPNISKKENVTYQGVTYTDEVTKISSIEKASFSIIITDTALISNVIANNNNAALFTEYIKKLNEQNKIEHVNEIIEKSNASVNANQVHNATEYISSLEIMLRTIQIHSLGVAIDKTGDPEIKKEVYTVDLTTEKTSLKSENPLLIKQIFSTGIFSPFIEDLINKGKNYPESGYPKENRLAIYAKYGFNTALLGGKTATKEDDTGLQLLKGKEVNYKDLLQSYVVPYQINQTLNEGTSLNHPVYIQFGMLLMILNHMCTIYDKPNGSTALKDQTPLVYIDFNPETNFCLSTNKHLSTNPFRFLIPFEGTFKDYKSLFDEKLLEGKDKENIQHTSDSEESTPLFLNPNTQDTLLQDKLSGQIPRFKYAEETTSGTAYRGKIMKVLINIEYLLDMIRQYSQKNETNNVYLKPFLEQILSDLNRSLGNFNLLRLAYNDSGNTFHIVDDQLCPGDEKEDFIPIDDTSLIPLYGKKSIGKNVQIKTDISTKLSNMIAISSNSDKGAKSTLSTDGTSFGFINTDYVDRYINNKTEIEELSEEEKKKKEDAYKKKEDRIKDTLIKQAITFNQTIKDFYSTINPSNSSVDQATNYYIQKMSKIKSDDPATRASAMIPVSLNFTTDGIAGMNMGQGFTISNKFLPYTYNIRNITGVGVSNTQKVGFVVFGLTHNFENNQWNTDVRANMMYLKKITDFNESANKANTNKSAFNYNTSNIDSYNTFTNPVLNPIFLGVSSERDATNGGALEQRIVNISNAIFAEIHSKDKNIKINVTGGNDKFHQEKIPYDSKHKVGRAVDFTIYPFNAQNKDLVSLVLNSFKSKEQGFSFINEYDKLSPLGKGGHFHIEYS
jgi:hypothetical protein